MLVHHTATIVKEYMVGQFKEKEDEAFREGYAKGLKAVSLICIYSPDVADISVVNGHPEIAQVVQSALTLRDTDNPQDDQNEYPQVEIPIFGDAADFVDRLRGQRHRRLGTINGERIPMTVTGHVLTNDEGDEDFLGNCRVVIGERYEVDGYCLGAIQFCGTGVILSADNRLFAYSVPTAVNPPWKHLDGSPGAEIFIDAGGEITLKNIPDLEVESLEEF